MRKRAGLFTLCVALGVAGLAGLIALMYATGQGRLPGRAAATVAAEKLPYSPASALPTSGGRRWIGFDAPPAPGDMEPVETLQGQIGAHVDVVSFFVADGEPFPEDACRHAAANGSIPLVTLEFWSAAHGGVSAIVNGSDDWYLGEFADAAREYGGEIWLRPLHEMNGDVYPWGSGSNSPGEIVAAFRHVHDVFAAHGARNVKFVWCPNVDLDVSEYFPGDAFIDFAAMDGYNNGEPWRSFSDVFGPTYNSIAKLTRKPIFIAETSCAESGDGAKARWIAEMFGDICSRYPRIVGVVWFNEAKSYDWRVDTSDSSLAAFSAGVAKGF
jgi:mannan endo-1,4-beta-mannosidase